MNSPPIHLENRAGMIGRMLLAVVFLSLAQVAFADLEGSQGQLSVARDMDGRLHVFKVDRIGELRQRWQKDPSGDWTSWSNLGGPVLPGIAVTTNNDGYFEAFAVSKFGGRLAWIHQKTPNSAWSQWVNLGGKVLAPAALAHSSAGTIEVFAVNAAGNVMQIGQRNDNEWSPWTNLGGHVMPGIVVVGKSNGCLEVFGVDSGSRNLMHCWQTAPDSSRSWSTWQNLGGSLLPGIAIGKDTNGTLELFGVDSRSHTVDYLYQTLDDRGTQWSAWTKFGPVKVLDGLTINQNEDGRLELFAVGREKKQVFHRWQVYQNTKTWFPVWDSLGGNAIPPLAAGLNQDGSQEIFAIDAENGTTLNHIRQIRANSDWLDWYSIEYLASPYTAVSWQTDEGLPHNVVRAITQTPDGYIWVGTLGGLARFDGVHFKIFDSRTTAALKDSHITALCVDSRGALWIGTDDGLVESKDGVFTRFGRDAGLAGRNINVISQSTDGSLWIGTEAGLICRQDGVFRSYGPANGLSSDSVRAIYQDESGVLWVGGIGGLYYSTDSRMDHFERVNRLESNSIRGITQDKGGRLWIGSDKGMIWHHLGSEFYAYDRRYGLSDPFVNVVCDDHQGNLWVGTHSGLNRFRGGRFFNELDNEGDPYDEVNAIFEDRNGSLWIGSNEGLTQLTPRRFFAYDMREGLSHNDTVSVLQDHDGNMWIGTYGGGLNEIRDETVTLYCTTNGLANDEVLALCETADGSLWAGEDNDGGLYRIRNGRITRFTSTDGLIGAGIQVIHQDRSGNLWIGTSRGLSCLKDSRFVNYSPRDYHGGNAIRAIAEDQKGDLWFGTSHGLCRFDGTGFVNFTTKQGLSDNSVTALYFDSEGNLWVGTENGGLDRFRDGRFKAYTGQQGLFSDDIDEIVEDDYGWLWMSCPKGIFRVRKMDLDQLDRGSRNSVVCINYEKSDGMETTLCNGMAKPSAWKAQDGRLWFVTTKGLVVVNPRIKLNTTPAPVFIEQLLVDGKKTIGISPDLAGQTRLAIPPGRGSLEFQFTMLDFKKPNKDHFLCQLKGVDSDWVDVGSRRSANYNNLRPGHYVFRVKACDADGAWNEAGASLDFVLLPHFWQTWWFNIAAVLAAVGAVSGAARYATRRRMQRKMEVLERQNAVEKERSRIAKDIHDDLGSRLTRMMLLGQRVQEDAGNSEKLATHARKMVDSAVQTMQIMDEIVWAVDPQKDTLNGLIGYISQYANEFLEETHIRCRLEMPINVPAIVIPAEARHELFLALKEALTNAVKHSGASEVRIALRESDGVVIIVVEDNGCGIGSGETRRKGSGLDNIVKRMEKLGGECEVSTAPGSGTRVQFTLRIK